MERWLRSGRSIALNHSGAFGLGTATYANLVPGEQLGIVVLTNAYPLGIAEALGRPLWISHCMANPLKIGFRLFKQVYSQPGSDWDGVRVRLLQTTGIGDTRAEKQAPTLGNIRTITLATCFIGTSVFRTLHDCQSAVLFDDGDVAKVIVRIFPSVALFSARVSPMPVVAIIEP